MVLCVFSVFLCVIKKRTDTEVHRADTELHREGTYVTFDYLGSIFIS
jgi:hypothetical protein